MDSTPKCNWNFTGWRRS